MRKMRVLLSVVSLLLLAAGPVLAAGPDLVVLSPKDGRTTDHIVPIYDEVYPHGELP